MTLKNRIERLERQRQQQVRDNIDRPEMVFLNVPDGKPDVVYWSRGRRAPVADGRAVLAEHVGHYVKVYHGIDPEWI